MKKQIKSKKDLIQLAFAEDQTIVRKGIINLLDNYEAFNVLIEASDGRELIEKLNTTQTLPDICIIDISMKNMNGFETVTAIKTKWPNMKILVLTMQENEFYIIRMYRMGANGYVLKKFDPDELRHALFSIYHQGYYYSEIATGALLNKAVDFPEFTAKETEVLKYCFTNLSYSEMAQKMNATTRSIWGYRDSLFKKLNVHDRTSLVLLAIQLGIIPLNNFPNAVGINT